MESKYGLTMSICRFRSLIYRHTNCTVKTKPDFTWISWNSRTPYNPKYLQIARWRKTFRVDIFLGYLINNNISLYTLDSSFLPSTNILRINLQPPLWYRILALSILCWGIGTWKFSVKRRLSISWIQHLMSRPNSKYHTFGIGIGQVRAIRYAQRGIFLQVCIYKVKLESHMSTGSENQETGYYSGFRSFLLVTACHTAVKLLGLSELESRSLHMFYPLT